MWCPAVKSHKASALRRQDKLALQYIRYKAYPP